MENRLDGGKPGGQMDGYKKGIAATLRQWDEEKAINYRDIQGVRD